jgi:hypothetical protein
MTKQWHYTRDGEKHGPVSDAELRQLAANGSLQPDDLIWKEGMTDWRKAGSVKGLFSDDNQSPPPVPPKPSSETAAKPTVADQLKKGVGVLGASAKLTSQLAAKQAETTKIQKVSLPKAYAQFGKHVFENTEARPDNEAHYAEINTLIEKIASLKGNESEIAKNASLGETAKALGSKASAVAQKKVIEHKLRQQYATLGKQSYERGDQPASCEDLTNAVRQLLKRQDDLKTEITELKQQMSQQGEQVKQLASSAAKGAHSFLFSAGVVVCLAVFCAPIGLFMIWKHPIWTKGQKLRWAVVSIACFTLFSVMYQMQKSAALKTLAEANQLWESGSKEDAIDRYRSLASGSDLTHLDKQDRARVLRRVIEFDCENDNPEAARELIKRADSFGIELSLTNPKAKAIVAQIEAERKAELEKERQAQAASSGSTAASSSEETEAINAMALLVVALIAENKSWGSTTPSRFNQLMKIAAKEIGFGNKPEMRHLLSITPSFEKPFETSFKEGGKGQGKIVKYGDVTCMFILHSKTGSWVLFTVTIRDKQYSMLGVSNAR